MTQAKVLRHEFVEFIPDVLDEGTLYISMGYAIVAHKCCCGCGQETITPLSPTDWKLTYDGKTISLDPSIGNWSFDCQSHYWVEGSTVMWATRWSREEIAGGRSRDRFAKGRYVDVASTASGEAPQGTAGAREVADVEARLWQKLKKRWSKLRGRA